MSIDHQPHPASPGGAPADAESEAEVRARVDALDVQDLKAQRRASDAVLALGPRAAVPLIEALHAGPPAVRKSAAYLLGRLRPADPIAAALGRAVREDLEPKVRQNAAVALGRSGAAGAVPDLAAALETETAPWVRSSVILALGALGGEAARAALLAATPGSDLEREAIRKALDRTAPRRRAASWRMEGVPALDLRLRVPIGLEAIAREEAEQRLGGPVEEPGPGLLRPPAGAMPDAMIPALRCAYGLQVVAGDGRPIPLGSPPEAAAAIGALLTESAVLRGWRGWLDVPDDTVRYRFSLEGQAPDRGALRALLDAVRAACRPFGWIDSPSRYDLELKVVADEAASRAYLVPSFMPDGRFDYRVADVGASMQPVVAACLARLARTSDRAHVFDPTCGSGTLLIERGILDPGARLIGRDISPSAVAASKRNLEAAGMSTRADLAVGDAMEPATWPPCEEVVANLPFGIRTRRPEADLESLYAAVLAQLCSHLSADGRAVLYTAHRRLMERNLGRFGGRLRVEGRARVCAGGLWCHIWVLGRRRRSTLPAGRSSGRT